MTTRMMNLCHRNQFILKRVKNKRYQKERRFQVQNFIGLPLPKLLGVKSEKRMISTILSETSNVAPEDPNDIFGKFIACELKQLGLREQRIAKHKMEGILFRIQMQSERQKSTAIMPIAA